MSILSYGQRCVIVGGCPENIGLIVMVIQRLGAYQGREDAYWIRTISGRPFHQLWINFPTWLLGTLATGIYIWRIRRG